MIKGIGIDMVEMDRIKQSIKRNPRFVQRILTRAEHLRFNELSEQRQIEYLSGRFAAKEAAGKAMGTGIGQLSFQDIEVLSTESGAPEMKVKGYDQLKTWISISHSSDHAIAQVVLEE
ncbi:4'-phosphopantetheinyl transferase [Halobacillus sp. BBL2006]|nr:holo-ACP synthase [Halobacillus sp. BBL2006]KHE66902.1 4'-phosphopantetheinyl transferase [Halobacillus sp. BBL2006]